MLPPDAIAKGQKLMQLYRGGVGGERTNAGRLLLAHLKTNDLTLYDLDSSLPVTQDVSALDHWRESAALMAKLGGPEQDDVLTQLVDAPDLTNTELLRLLEVVDLESLINLRADGWAYTSGDVGAAEQYRAAGLRVTAQSLLGFSGSLAQRLRNAVLQQHHFQTHPQRLLRAEDELQQHFLAGLVLALTGHEAELVAGGVQAHLDAGQLARLRALQAQHSAQARAAALQAAQEFGQRLS
ncbi:hypothetical protein [Deinococcus sp.]|uniref:hypothetical protein n=1 Tax=Deinococcus sp. TaxID=47478 RepID=UPI0025BC39C3|nr:hypothetical protein [Deinococcus sp.]